MTAESIQNQRDSIFWCGILTTLFWLLCLVRLTIPGEPYFDETHYLPAARELLNLGLFTNREHPLFAKELLALAIAWLGDNPWGWRILPTLAGAATLFASMRAMWISSRSSFATIAFGLLLASGFHLFVHARIAMLDIFYVCFLSIAIWRYAAAIRRPEKGRINLIATGVALGLAMASKWNAIPYAILPGLAFLAYRLKAGRRRLLLSRRGTPIPGVSLIEAALWLGVLPLTIYALTFMPAYYFAQQPIESLIGHHQTMLNLQTQVLKEHPYQSTWPQWLMNSRAIWYLYEPVEGVQRGVLLIGNPLTMLLGLPAMVWCVWRAFTRRDPLCIAIASLYATGVGFWIVAAKPVQFYYHYFFPSMILLAALALALDSLWQKGMRWAATIPIISSLVLFAYFFPILSAAPLDDPMAFTKWAWFDSWR